MSLRDLANKVKIDRLLMEIADELINLLLKPFLDENNDRKE